MAYTTSDFLTSVKRAVTIPASQIRFDDDDILAIGDEQMSTFLLPIITSIRQEFFVVKSYVTIVASQSNYKIPYRSIGRTLREIKATNSATAPSNTYPVPMCVPEDTQRYLYGNMVGDVKAYTVRGDNIVILPPPGTAPTQLLEFYYELAPSKLVDTTTCGVVSTVNTGTGAVTLSSAISTFTTGQTMDLIDGQSGNTVTAIDIVNTNVTGAVVTFNAADLPVAPNALKAGDYIAPSGQTPVLQIPNECFFVLVQATVCKILEAQGDFEGLQASEGKLAKNVEAMQKTLTPRVESDVPTIVNTNGLIRNRLWQNQYYRYNL